MKIKVSAMKLDRMKVELRNEEYLDSLGSGTTDKVREAELSYNVAQLEYEQLQQQYANEKEVLAAEYQVQELDLGVFRKHWPKTKRSLDDAQVRSPRKAILTYIDNQIGAPGCRRLTDCQYCPTWSLQGGRRDCQYLR